MQNLFIAWLALPVVMLFASLFAFYLATAALLVWLSFRPYPKLQGARSSVLRFDRYHLRLAGRVLVERYLGAQQASLARGSC